MKFTKIKIAGKDFTVIFDGSNYILHSALYGLAAIAERNATSKYDERFCVKIGNSSIIGITDDIIVSAIKEHIRKVENTHIRGAEIQFPIIREDLTKLYIKISIEQY